MTLQELKKMIENEVSNAYSIMREPEPVGKIATPQKTKAELSEEDLDGFVFHGQQKPEDDKNIVIPKI